MTTESELSGVDLARQALVAAREAARKNGGRRKEKPKRQTGKVVRRDGRDPLGLAAAIGMMMTERGLAAPAAGGSVLAQWEDILTASTPELARHVWPQDAVRHHTPRPPPPDPAPRGADSALRANSRARNANNAMNLSSTMSMHPPRSPTGRSHGSQTEPGDRRREREAVAVASASVSADTGHAIWLSARSAH
jgi:hypothetical protein